MAQSQVYNNTPKTILNGIYDGSQQTPVASTDQVPIHLPFFYIQAPTGTTDDAILLGSGDLTRLYGAGAIDPRQGFFNHATLLASQIMQQGNSIFVKRLVRPSAPISITAMVPDTRYTIYNLGTVTTPSDWNFVGVTGTPSVGTSFIAGTGTLVAGDGQVTANNPNKAGFTLGVSMNNTTPIFNYQRAADGSVVEDINGNKLYAVVTPNVAIGSFTANTSYQITSLGTGANWTALGVTGTPAIGSIFTTLSTGFVGTSAAGGTANQLSVIPGGITLSYQLYSNLNSVFTDGAYVEINGTQVYPLLQFTSNFYGVLSNTTGIKIWTAGPNAVMPGDTDVILDQNAVLFNAQIMVKPTNATAIAVDDLNGASSCTFSFKPNAYNYKTNLNLDINQLIDNWSDDGIATKTSPTYSPVGGLTVFNENLVTVLTRLQTIENTTSSLPEISSIYYIDPFTALDTSGNPYYGFQIDTNGLILNSSNTLYFMDGNDGDLTNATFETAVLEEVNYNYNLPTCNLLDSARYPFSHIYDSGFTTTGGVKLALGKWTSYRKDVMYTLGTHQVDGTNTQLDITAELSLARSLTLGLSIYSESVLWGTPATRIVLMSQSGYLINGASSQPVSTLFDLAVKRAKYFGSGSGAVAIANQYITDGGNDITTLKKISNPSMSDAAKQTLYTLGVNYCQFNDRNTLFFPSLQTIYSSSGIMDSVLVGEVFVNICADIEKKAEIVWRRLVGDETLTQAQFIKKSNNLMTSLTTGIYGPGITVIPNTSFTAADSARGYSWTMDVSVAGNVPKNVGSVNVIVTRQAPTTTTSIV